MKVISAIINPIPDEEGYHILECNKCQNLFLVNPQDMEEKVHCPFCGTLGGVIEFTHNIREKLFKDHPITQKTLEKDSKENQQVDVDKIKELLKNLDKETLDLEVLSYSVDEVIEPESLMTYEFICCDKSIKIPMEIYNSVNFCSFCRGEILLNVLE